MTRTISTPVLLSTTAGFGYLGYEVAHRLNEAHLHGQVVIVTGASRGLGLLLAREFGLQGCQVVICARDSDELEAARRQLEGQGLVVYPYPCDVADRTQAEHLVEQVVAQFGRIDILVNNAGIIQATPLENATIEDFESAMNVMFWGLFYMSMAAVPHMKEQHYGRIVNVTSIGGKVSVPHLLPYSTAKFAATGFSEGLHAELKQHGIIVTTITPGLMRTGSYLNAEFKGQQDKEFTWFSVADNLPFVSMDAELAAREIVQATRRGETERVLTLPAYLLARLHGLMPGITSDVMALVNHYVLPGAKAGGKVAERGMNVWSQIGNPLLAKLLTWGRSAARRNNEYPGPINADPEPDEYEAPEVTP